MDLLFAALCGLFVFISPCVLPMLPVYVTYFTAGEANKRKTFFNACGFAIGVMAFWIVICTLLAVAGVHFKSYIEDNKIVNIVLGIIVMVLGVHFMGFIKIPFLNTQHSISTKVDKMGFISALIMGLIFALMMGPCAISFGSFALIQSAIDSNYWYNGTLIGIAFSGTMGILFIAGAMGINQLKGTFNFIKRNYKVINIVSGSILVLLGFIIAMGWMKYISAFFVNLF